VIVWNNWNRIGKPPKLFAGTGTPDLLDLGETTLLVDVELGNKVSISRHISSINEACKL
jgi:hypothetical protein